MTASHVHGASLIQFGQGVPGRAEIHCTTPSRLRVTLYPCVARMSASSLTMRGHPPKTSGCAGTAASSCTELRLVRAWHGNSAASETSSFAELLTNLVVVRLGNWARALAKVA
jgi:hypothetical protein